MHTDVLDHCDTSSLGANIASIDITGFEVEALDGGIGKVDEATYEVGSSYLVIDTARGSSARRSCCRRVS